MEAGEEAAAAAAAAAADAMVGICVGYARLLALELLRGKVVVEVGETFATGTYVRVLVGKELLILDVAAFELYDLRGVLGDVRPPAMHVAVGRLGACAPLDLGHGGSEPWKPGRNLLFSRLGPIPDAESCLNLE